MEKTSLLGQWKGKKKTEAPRNKIGKAPDAAVVPLSHGQQRLWFLQQLYPGNSFYNYSQEYRFKGTLNEDTLLEALELVFKNHDILRTVYVLEGGLPNMQVAPEPEFSVLKYDVRPSGENNALDVSDIKVTDAKHSFDLSKPPVALVSIMRTEEDEHLILLTVHHIAMDKWSMNLLCKEWASNYQALEKSSTPAARPPEVQYTDFAYWQRNRKIKREQLDYWKGKLAGDIPMIDLPTDYPRPRNTSFAGRSSEFRHFSDKTSRAILQFCRQEGVTPYIFFLSIYYVFLYRYTGQNDILIGSPISNRDQKQLENTIGFFNDTIVLRTEITAYRKFIDTLKAVKKTVLEAFSNKDVPFDLLVSELKQDRSVAVNPFFQVMFLYYSVSETPSFGEKLQVESEFYNPGVSKFDLTFDVSKENGRLSYAFEYSTELFSAKTIARFQEHISLLVEAVVAAPELPISEIEMLTKAEKEALLPEIPVPTDTFENFAGIHQCIERMAATRPDSIAVTFKDICITYAELNDRSYRLAVQLLEKTKGRNAIVGLCVDRSTEMIVGLLAILKAGCAYLPIDPKYPEQRIDFVLQDAQVDCIVTQKSLLSRFGNTQMQRFLADAIDTSEARPQVPMPIPKKQDLAYVIYTSGSTGNPKGVPITHANILNSTAGRLDYYPVNPKTFLLLSSISFDSSKAGIFWTLCTGGNLVVTEDRMEQDMVAIGNVVRKNQVTHMLLLPTLYQLVLEHAETLALKSLTTVIVAGEACFPSLVDVHFNNLPETVLYNEYGPTEATVWCIAHKVDQKASKNKVPLGLPVARSKVYLLNAALTPVPFGATGEIYIGGPGLSSGYLHRADLTAKSYIENPFSKETGDRLYKTGDLARYTSDGLLEFQGRSDRQVKIRGYRVELEEIEKAIRGIVEVRQVAVLAEANGSTQRVAAYLTASEVVNSVTLQMALRKNLPDYMVPSSITQLDTLPVLPNGKIDRASLQKLKRVAEGDQSIEKQPPGNETESKLHAIWQNLLKLEDIGIHDNFFELGGDSILSIQFIAKARKAGIHLTPNQIFDNQTIASLAAYLSSKEKRTGEWDYLVALRKEGSEKPLFCIHAGGGHVFFYNVLTKYITAHRPIYALQASGVYGDKGMHHSIEAMAADYIQAIKSVQLTGPYNILVYCFSVAVGHEMVLQWAASGEKTNLIVMDTMTDPWRLDTGNRLKIRIKSFVKRLASRPLQTVSGMINERLIGLRLKLRQTMSRGDDKALAQLNANLARICAAYDWRPHQEKVTVMLTEKPEESFNEEVVGSWKKVALGGVNIVRTRGNHIDLFAEPEVAIVAEGIEENCI